MTPLVDGLLHNFAQRSAKNDLLMLSDWVNTLFELRQLQQQLLRDQEKIYVKAEKNGFRRGDVTRLVHLLEVPAEAKIATGEVTSALNQCLKYQFKNPPKAQPEGVVGIANIGHHTPDTQPWLPKSYSNFSVQIATMMPSKPLIRKNDR